MTAHTSIALPVKNGAATLEPLLEVLEAQQVGGGLEIVAVDSGSTDGSVDILRRHAVRVIQIPPESFDHGETRNLAAREATAERLVFLTQDALPTDRSFVGRLVAVLDSDRRLAGSFARQVPRSDADPLTRRDLASWVAAQPAPRVVFADDKQRFDALPAIKRYHLSVFDNVASAVRRQVLLAHPFQAIRFGEDLEWGQRMLGLGYGLAYVPEAVVIHSHRRSARSLYRRNYLGHRLLFRLFGLTSVPDRPHLLRAAAGAIVQDLGTLARGGATAKSWLAAPLQSLAATYGQYRGARDEALSREYPAWAARP